MTIKIHVMYKLTNMESPEEEEKTFPSVEEARLWLDGLAQTIGVEDIALLAAEGATGEEMGFDG